MSGYLGRLRVFAEPMYVYIAGVVVWVEARLGLQNPERLDTCRHERGLGVRGQGELILRPLEHQVGKLLIQGAVDAVENLPRDAKLVCQRLSHADRLGALTRKYQGRLHGPVSPNERDRATSSRPGAAGGDTTQAGMSSARSPRQKSD